MKKIMISKTKKEGTLLFINLINTNIIEKILSLFNLKFLYGECFLDKAESLESDYFDDSEDVRILYTENTRKHKQLIIGVPQKSLRKFIDITEKFNTTLGGCSGEKNDWDLFVANRKLKDYDVSFAVNDNNGTSISFNLEKYDFDNIVSKVKAIVE